VLNRCHQCPRRVVMDGFTRRLVEATTGIEPVYAVLQSPPERAPLSANVRDSRSIRALGSSSSVAVATSRCYQRAPLGIPRRRRLKPDPAHEAARRIVGVLVPANLIEGAGVPLQASSASMTPGSRMGRFYALPRTGRFYALPLSGLATGKPSAMMSSNSRSPSSSPGGSVSRR
jgi:hypothetical protein